MVNFAQNMHILYEEPKSDDTYPYKILEPALFPNTIMHCIKANYLYSSRAISLFGQTQALQGLYSLKRHQQYIRKHAHPLRRTKI
jgi:hypothetical protein